MYLYQLPERILQKHIKRIWELTLFFNQRCKITSQETIFFFEGDESMNDTNAIQVLYKYI